MARGSDTESTDSAIAAGSIMTVFDNIHCCRPVASMVVSHLTKAVLHRKVEAVPMDPCDSG